MLNNILVDVCEKEGAQMELPLEKTINVVKEIYRPFTTKQLSDISTEIISPKNVGAVVKLIFQSIEGLHSACPNHLSDWYFSSYYPTSGGNRVVNRAFINYMEGKNVRAY